MKTMIINRCCVALAILFISWGMLYAEAFEMQITPGPALTALGIDFTDYQAASATLTEYPNLFFHKNNEVIPTGLAMANVLGYPNGRAMIGQFPHFEIGVSAGVSTYQLFRYRDYDIHNPEIPGAGVNGGIHFGTGIDDRMDIMFKIFVLGSFYIYDREINQSVTHDTTIDREYTVEVTDNSIYSFGVKSRYNLIRPRPRSLFSFGGLNINLAFDYMSARFAAKGEYITTKDVDITIPDFVFGETQTTLEVIASVRGASAIQWHFFSVTPEIITYFNLLYAINIYTGFALSINRGAVTFETNAVGELRNVTPIEAPSTSTTLVPANQVIASANMHADASMTPHVLLPRYILGFEIDFFLFKMTVEASTVLTSPTDSFAAQIGVRTEI